MPKLDLTMNQWGIVLRAVRYAKNHNGSSAEENNQLYVIEDRIIDMAFQLAKEAEDMKTSKKDSWEELAERHTRDVKAEQERQTTEYGSKD